ncbi:Glycerol kinase [uncultured Ruminococcus sp.]|nr:Glycerol kinase [uncultured Clostridium sp.]SCI27819.1 Glycerol kinase [uncultured Ruminococcus sp.]
MKYILAIDQSTSGTKALLFDSVGDLIARSDLPHRQIILNDGWVEHDPDEIYQNVLGVVKDVIRKSGIDQDEIVGVGISNQRETVMAWDNRTGEPVYNAIVWQCSRAEKICEQLYEKAETIRTATGLPLSPYFSAAKAAWIVENVEGVREKAENGNINCGTMDSWVVYKLTNGRSFKTDYSNASRTQLFNITSLEWDKEVCKIFGVEKLCLPEVCDSNANFGMTDFNGLLKAPIPIHGVLGDSHGALCGQGCHKVGMTKTTYGTGSSVMMNIGEKPVLSEKGVVTSLAWGIDGKVTYVLEGNINYTGAVMKWVVDDLGLIDSPKMSGKIAFEANPEDTTYLVPAFTGLGAPYWDSKAKAIICGMTRNTGRAEIVRAAEECIGYQITDILTIMSEEASIPLRELRVDGGPTRDKYLMQFQSDMLGIPVRVPAIEELSGVGPAYLAGIAMGVYDSHVFERLERISFTPQMSDETRAKRYSGWKEAVRLVLSK